MTAEPAGQESGGKLREQFEATRKVLVETYVANNPVLKPGDFDGVDPTQFATRADEVKVVRAAEADELLKQALTAKGLDGDLDSIIAKLKDPDSTPETPSETPDSRIASLSKLGAPPARPDAQATEGLFGRSRIEAAIARDAAKS